MQNNSRNCSIKGKYKYITTQNSYVLGNTIHLVYLENVIINLILYIELKETQQLYLSYFAAWLNKITCSRHVQRLYIIFNLDGGQTGNVNTVVQFMDGVYVTVDLLLCKSILLIFQFIFMYREWNGHFCFIPYWYTKKQSN